MGPSADARVAWAEDLSDPADRVGSRRHGASDGGAMIAALYVEKDGPYFGRSDVDPWDEVRDARLYAGPYPVVGHPPCARWCRLAGLVEARWGHKRGEDGGCFERGLASVRKWGGAFLSILRIATRGAPSSCQHRRLVPAGCVTSTADGHATWSKVDTATLRRKRRGSTPSTANCRLFVGVTCLTRTPGSGCHGAETTRGGTRAEAGRVSAAIEQREHRTSFEMS